MEGGGGTEIRKIIFYLTNIPLTKNIKQVVFVYILPIHFMILYNTKGMSHLKFAGIYTNSTY